jgi:hypothetical protein
MKKYCQRCKKYHHSPPVDPNKIVQDHAKELAKHIDQEILNDIITIEKRRIRSSTST